MPGVLIYGNELGKIQELRTAAEIVAQGRDIKTLVLSSCYSGEMSPAGPVLVAGGAISTSDGAAVAEIIKQVAEKQGSDILLLTADRRGKELAGRLGQKLGAGVLTDVAGLCLRDGAVVASRNALGGAVVQEAVVTSGAQILALVTRSFPEAAPVPGSAEYLEISAPSSLELLDVRPKSRDSVDISAAETLLVMGCGFENQGDVETVEALAKRLQGGVGCSKPLAADRKWFGDDRIIGISGKTCKPGLAILLGISGQVQFWAGIRDAKIIVAVNSDENAPIMAMSDYALTMDVRSFLAEFSP
jgi:electron transfer flavoprotein alpha subunit